MILNLQRNYTLINKIGLEIQLRKKVSFITIFIQADQSEMDSDKQKYLKRVKTLSSMSKSEYVVQAPIQKNSRLAIISRQKEDKKPSRSVFKTIGYKNISSHNEAPKRLNVRHHRSITSTGGYNLLYNPYQNLIKQLNIVLPSPKQKFYQFLQISPFNRTPHHVELIQHFLKQYKFFKNHPNQILEEIAKKIRICQTHEIDQKYMAVVENGQCIYEKQKYQKGEVMGRRQLNPQGIIANPETKFLVINRHQYKFLVSCYLDNQKQKFRTFLSSIQIFKMFSKKAFDKFMQNLTLNYFSQGEYLYKFGEQANNLFIVFKGKAVRRVIVQIDKTNKIPMLKYSKIVKILSKSYEHKIQFSKQDLIGIAEVIDHIETIKQNIKMEENSIILGLDKHVFQQNLDEYIIDRLRKYNLKKYPVTYDKLCQKYEKQMMSVKQEQMRKIQALKSTINTGVSDKRVQTINSIIKKYQQNIKKSEVMNLLECKIQQRKVQRQ